MLYGSHSKRVRAFKKGDFSMTIDSYTTLIRTFEHLPTLNILARVFSLKLLSVGHSNNICNNYSDLEKLEDRVGRGLYRSVCRNCSNVRPTVAQAIAIIRKYTFLLIRTPSNECFVANRSYLIFTFEQYVRTLTGG